MKDYSPGIDFESLLFELEKEVKAGYIQVSEKGDLRMYHYTSKCVTAKDWTPACRMARGLILDLKTKEIVARPFKKFFNYGEMTLEYPRESFEAYEKMDGSMGILFFHDGRWKITTKGSFYSEQGFFAQGWFDANVSEAVQKEMFKATTYIVEIIYPQNRIVVDYGDFSGLVLLGAISRDYGFESDSATVDQMAEKMGLLRPRRLFEGKSFNDVLAYKELFSDNEEGVVVRFKNGYRLKVKGNAYCRLHKLGEQITPLFIWENMRDCEDIEKLRASCSDRFLKRFQKYQKLFQVAFDNVCEKLEKVNKKAKKWSDKELGVRMGRLPKGDNKRLQYILVFEMRKGRYNPLEKGRVRASIFEQFRPTGNKIQGLEN